jgi:hypothetical protein
MYIYSNGLIILILQLTYLPIIKPLILQSSYRTIYINTRKSKNHRTRKESQYSNTILNK